VHKEPSSVLIQDTALNNVVLTVALFFTSSISAAFQRVIFAASSRYRVSRPRCIGQRGAGETSANIRPRHCKSDERKDAYMTAL